MTDESRRDDANGHRHFEEDVAAYVLDALEPDARRALERHLETCERCRNDLEWLRAAEVALATSVPQLDPPRRLRRRILRAARADAEEGQAGMRASPLRHGWLAPAAAGLAAVAIAVGVTAIVDGSDEDARVVQVDLAGAAADAEGVLIVTGETATLEVEDMPGLRADAVYQAWVERDGEIEPSNTFIVDRNGEGAVTIPDVAGADRVMVSREPRGGSERPTTKPLLVAPLGEA